MHFWFAFLFNASLEHGPVSRRFESRFASVIMLSFGLRSCSCFVRLEEAACFGFFAFLSRNSDFWYCFFPHLFDGLFQCWLLYAPEERWIVRPCSNFWRDQLDLVHPGIITCFVNSMHCVETSVYSASTDWMTADVWFWGSNWIIVLRVLEPCNILVTLCVIKYLILLFQYIMCWNHCGLDSTFWCHSWY